jgi:hypothetical protein
MDETPSQSETSAARLATATAADVPPILIVVGVSGSGMTTIAKALNGSAAP